MLRRGRLPTMAPHVEKQMTRRTPQRLFPIAIILLFLLSFVPPAAAVAKDTGDKLEPDLGNALFGADLTTGGSALGDLGGHGTHVAGIVAGNGTLSSGAYEGMAPGARILSVKVTTDDGKASYSSIIAGLQWIVTNAKAY